jgi:hypothetical protein
MFPWISNALPLAGITAEEWWSEQLFGLNQSQRFVLLIIAIGSVAIIVISTVSIVGGIIAGIHKRRLETELKRDLLDRGMSADEVARVVESAQPKDFLERWAAAQGKGTKT